MPKALFSRTGEPGSPPRDASSVLLLRDPLEVFFVRRAAASAFMGGMYVFPGGKLDPGDHAAELLARLPADAAERCARRMDPTPGRPLDTSIAAGLYVAACRETFEEAGVLLAAPADPAQHMDTPEAKERLNGHRATLAKDSGAFGEILKAEGLRLDLANMVYFTHWITPSLEARRYDTRFFLARIPEGQMPLIDAHETTDSAWLSPKAALDAYVRKEIQLAPPTIRILEDLLDVDSVEAACALAARRMVAPIMPKVGADGEHVAVILPWDPSFPDAEGETLDLGQGPHPMAAGSSRIVLEGDRWVTRGGGS